jgi:hypothetical protein
MKTQAIFNHQTFHNVVANITPNGNTLKYAVVLSGSVYQLLLNIPDTEKLPMWFDNQPQNTTALKANLRAVMIGIHGIAAHLKTTPLEAMLSKWSKKNFETVVNQAADFETLKAAIGGFYSFRYSATHGYPTAYDSAAFLLTEVGEIISELLQATGQFIRNNPEKSEGTPLIWELGDVYQMFLVTCIQLGIDPFESL